MKIWAILLLASLATQGSTRTTLGQIRPPIAGEGQASGELVDLLWSSDDAKRRAAKRNLLKLGPDAAPAILSLLGDLDAEPSKQRLPTDREDEARKALATDDDLSVEDFSSMEISWRLRDDAAELLGKLHVVEALPLLIRLMHRQVEIDWPKGLSTVMRSIAQLGAAAVPILVQEIENPLSTARSLVLLVEDSRSQFNMDLKLHVENNDAEGLWRAVPMVRIKDALVLGEIGDERALPVLERLLDPTREPPVLEVEADRLREAIRRIKQRARQK